MLLFYIRLSSLVNMTPPVPIFISNQPSQFRRNLVAIMYSRKLSVDDIHKLWLQASTSDQETVNIGLLGKFLAVL